MTSLQAPDPRILPANWTHDHVIVNGVRLHYVTAGTGPLVVLLHGFPEFWYAWRFQIPALAAAGYRVVAPDMRGYNLSEKPHGVAAYHIEHLAGDAAGLLRHFGGEAGGALVGHDWGGVVAWHTAARHSELVRKLIILNAPHPARYLELLRTDKTQRKKSWYVGFFQIPWLPELLLARTARRVAYFYRITGAHPTNTTFEDAQRVFAAQRQPGAATAMLNYYRAMFRRQLSRGLREQRSDIAVPTLLIWGERDVALVPANADPAALKRWVPDLRVERLDASHWVQADAPDRVNELLMDFLKDRL